MFCVVYISEKKIIKTVPDIWNSKNNGVTYVAWPQRKENFPVELNFLIKNRVPFKKNWPKYICVVLMSRIGNFNVSIVNFVN